MKKIIFSFLLFLSVKTMFAQGWVGNSPNTLFAVNNTLATTPIRVGIGTNAPIDALHMASGNLLMNNVTGALTGNIFLGSNVVANNHGRFYYEAGAGVNGGLVMSSKTATGNQGIIFRADLVSGATERMRINSNGNIGIATNNPSAGFHTNTSLRFEGLPLNTTATQMLVTDALGNVGYQTIPTGGGLDWSLSGNLATAASVLGTNNNFDLNIITNTVPRMVVKTGTGFVGLNQPTPLDRFHVSNGNMLTDYVNQDLSGNIFLGSNTITNNHLRFYYENGGGNPLKRGGTLSVKSGGLDEGMVFRVDNVDGQTHRMRIDAIGNVGINTGEFNSPTATLHVDAAFKPNDPGSNSNIRFEHLQNGHGNILVIDDQGYVYDSGKPLENAKSISDMRNELNELKSEFTLMKFNMEQSAIQSTTTGNQLFQNTPNPTSGKTTIGYQLNGKQTNARIAIYNLQHQQMSNITLDVKEGKSEISVNVSNYANGTYVYALLINDVLIDSKKMEIVQ